MTPPLAREGLLAANEKDAKEFCRGAFGPFVRDVSQYVQIVTELLEHATNRATGASAQDALDRGEAQRAIDFCQWLQGYFKGDLGKDDLTAFEANQIRNELNDRVFPGSAVSSTQSSPPDFKASQNSAESDPSAMPDWAGGETASSTHSRTVED